MVNANPEKLIVLEPVGDGPKDSAGMIDRRLFTGDNKIHLSQEPNGLWGMHYTKGVLPAPLQQKFTNRTYAIKAIEHYFKLRNLKIKEVIE